MDVIHYIYKYFRRPYCVSTLDRAPCISWEC